MWTCSSLLETAPALLGANGTGKTTLFKDILEQGAWENPVLRIGPKTKIGYYAQEHETLNPERSILEEVRREKGPDEGPGLHGAVQIPLQVGGYG